MKKPKRPPIKNRMPKNIRLGTMVHPDRKKQENKKRIRWQELIRLLG